MKNGEQMDKMTRWAGKFVNLVAGLGALSMLVFGLVSYASALRIQPMSNAMATSDNDASSIMLRDASGNFADGTMTGNVTGDVAGTVTGAMTYLRAVRQTYTGVYTSTTITPVSGYITIESSSTAGQVKMVTTPSISTAGFTTGQLLLITCPKNSTSVGVAFQDGGTLSLSGLQLGAATREVGPGDSLVLRYDSASPAEWMEVSYTDN